MLRLRSAVVLLLAVAAHAQRIDLVPVVSKQISQTIDLPGEFLPYESAEIHAKVRGYVERVLVDRGSAVRPGQLLAVLSAPEIKAQAAEAQSRVLAAESDRLEAEAQLTIATSTYNRLKKAAETPGAVAGNELATSEAQVKAAQAALESKEQAKAAVVQTAQAQKDLEAYLQITAPFGGVITQRLVHPGALVGSAEDPVLLVLDEVARLRLVVAVPEQNVGDIQSGVKVEFRVPAHSQRLYAAPVARISHALDEKTRTMAVELDVMNRDGSLSPGMYPSVKWPVNKARPSLLVPKTSVVTTTERTFVIRDENRHANWVNVSKGLTDGDLVEVFGDLQAGEKVVRRATDEIRDGSALK